MLKDQMNIINKEQMNIMNNEQMNIWWYIQEYRWNKGREEIGEEVGEKRSGWRLGMAKGEGK